MSVVSVCNEMITFTGDGSPLCESGWLVVQYETFGNFDVSTLVMSELMAAFTLGMFITVPPLMAAFGIGQLINLVRKS